MTPNDRLERSTWDLFWLPEGVATIDRPELLALHTPRPVGYLNTVYRTRAGQGQLPQLVEEVRGFHRAVDSRWTVTDTVDTAPLERELAAQGYAPGHRHDARVIEVDAYESRAPKGIRVERVCDERTLRDCWAATDSAFARQGQRAQEDIANELRLCASPEARVQRFVAYIDEIPVASGGVNLFPALGIALLWSGGTVPAARGRGAYSAVVAERIAWAAKRGLDFVGLYARETTSSPIVAAQGFKSVGRMTYWLRPASKS